MADVAHGHGGDGGSQDPNRNAHTISSICESSQAKRKRGQGRNLKLNTKREQNQGGPLSIEIVEGARQYKFVGPNASDFTRHISNLIVSHVPLHYKDWQSVPNEHKSAIYPSLFDYFDLKAYTKGDPIKWAGVQLGITSECKSRYSSRKNKFKDHFLNNGGYEDVETAKICHPKNYDSEKWVKLIDDLYMDPEYRKRCEANKNNRAKQKYPSFQGSQSFAQMNYKDEKETGKANHIRVFEKTHYKEGKGWANEACEADWGKIQEELAKSQRDAADSSTPVDEIGVLKRALGHKRGHLRGVGRVVRKITPEISSACPPPQQWQETQQEMQQQMQQMRQEMQEMRQQQQLQHQQEQVQPSSFHALMELMQQQKQQHEFQMQLMEKEFQREMREMKQRLPRHDDEDEDEDD